MRLRFHSAVFNLGLLLTFSSSARAQIGAECQSASASVTCSPVTITMRMAVPYVARLSLTNYATTVNALSAADLASGSRDFPGPGIIVQSNATYRIELQAAATWSYSGPFTNPSKTSADLRWSTSASGPFTASNVNSTVAGPLPATASNTSLSLFYRSLWSWASTPPGTYSLPVTLTLIAP